jgi:hypothetical protein
MLRTLTKNILRKREKKKKKEEWSSPSAEEVAFFAKV